MESVANGSSANSITENLPEKVTLVGSDGQEHSNVAGTWSAPEGFDGYTAGDYAFTFTPDSTEGLPVDAYGVATVVVTVEVPANLTTLGATLETAATKQETDYTASTWNAFTQAKTAAETVKNATLKTQREVDKANDDLTAAMNALAARADVTELSAELTKHTDKKENQYTTSTWSAFAEAKETAQAFVNDNSVATQAEVDRAKEELEALRQHLFCVRTRPTSRRRMKRQDGLRHGIDLLDVHAAELVGLSGSDGNGKGHYRR